MHSHDDPPRRARLVRLPPERIAQNGRDGSLTHRMSRRSETYRFRSRSPLRRSIMPNTVRLHRVMPTKPDKVYRAFIEADAMAKWLPPDGFTCTVHQFDGKVGGTFRMSFRNFTTGAGHFFG